MAILEEPWQAPDPDADRYTIAVEWTFRVTVRGDHYQDARRYVAEHLLPTAIMTMRGGLDSPGDFLDRGAILWDYVPGEEDDEDLPSMWASVRQDTLSQVPNTVEPVRNA